MLIIALGVLTLMAILGAAFASLMRLEKRATENYVDAKRMDLLLDSALDRIISELQGGKNFSSFTIYNNTPWLYMLKTEKDLAHGRVDMEDPRVGQEEIFSERAGQTYSYKSKVIDCSAQINLNGRQDTLARMLDNLGNAIEKSERLKRDGKKVTNPFYTKPNRGGNPVRGSDIVKLRRRLPEGRYSSKTQLRQLIGPENYEVVKDFVTVSSWEDPSTYKPTDGEDEVQDINTLTTSAKSLGGGSRGQVQPRANDPTPHFDSEPRHPININTAPEEVLIACLQGLAGRRVFPYSKLGAGASMVQVDLNAQITGERTIASEETRDLTPRAVYIYSPRLEYEHAKKLAQRIIAQRKIKPFMAWRTNTPSQAEGFEDFIDGLDASFFPSPQNCLVIDPDQPQNRQLEALIVRSPGNTDIGRMWVKGHGLGAVRSARKQKGLAFHEVNAWYYDLIKGVLKSNFNPNTRVSRYNPNAPAYVPVDKSDLVWAQTRDRLLKGHTTEFCFDTNGIYEITTLGRIATNSTDAPGATSVVGAPIGRASFEKKTRTVVKVFDLLRHTTQLDFEKTFASSSRTSKGDRKFVVTWPEPMGALTELVTSGTIRDGRVELAGLLDGQRLELPVQQRLQVFRNYPLLTMAHGFQDRDATSIAQLKRFRSGRSSAFGSKEYDEALRDVLNASYSKRRATNRRYLRRSELTQRAIYKNQDAIPIDPNVSKEAFGTDLFPDGLSVSLLRMNHVGARFLVLPAHNRIGDSSGDGNSLYGASGLVGRQNVYGNIPYYRGGIAFWVKFEFDGDDPVFSGLVGCTQVIKQVPAAATDFTGSEGTQFFIFKNSKGEMRVVRMYYHQAFLDGTGGDGGSGGGGGAGNAEAVKLYPDPGIAGGDSGGPAGAQNPILANLDQKKITSHSDKVIDVRHFKAHEWHHIAVDWEDENQRYPFRVYIDFQEDKAGGAPRLAQAIVDGTANSWVRLNERQPKDGLQIGGILREQGVSDAGVFKWFSNSSAPISGGRGAVVTVAPSVKRILANATIDEFIAYEGSFLGAKQYYGASGAPGYFTPQTGEYANLFEIALPPDVDHVVLRSFDWTSYYPTLYTDSRTNSVPTPLQLTRGIECELNYVTPTTLPAPFDESWHRPSVPNMVAGRTAYWRTGDLKGHKADFVYKFRMHGARSQQGNTAGGVVQTPVIDDVTLTYFLPNPKILIQEEDN
jgi:hypothetical protein